MGGGGRGEGGEGCLVGCMGILVGFGGMGLVFLGGSVEEAVTQGIGLMLVSAFSCRGGRRRRGSCIGFSDWIRKRSWRYKEADDVVFVERQAEAYPCSRRLGADS